MARTLRALPRLLRGFLPSALVLHRLDPARSFRLPTWQLEGLRGRERRARAKVLSSGAGEVPLWLTFASLLFELGLGAALLVAVPLLTPEWLGIDWELVGRRLAAGAGPAWARAILVAAPVVSFALLEPFYVGAGFGLYLNRRTRLEGWDLEIAFRRLAARARRLAEGRAAAERQARTRGSAGAVLALLLLAVALALSGALPAAAQEAQAVPPPDAAAPPGIGPAWATWEGEAEDDPRALASAILGRETFARQVTITRWRLRGDLSGKGRPKSERGPAHLLASLLVPLLWVLFVLLVLLAVGQALQASGLVDWGGGRERDAGPGTVLGLDIRPESLPEDIPARAEALWRSGRRTEALSLLYRGALARLVERDRVPLRESFTEEDCLASAGDRVGAACLKYLAGLTRGWQRTAYAHRPPTEDEAERLWRSWARHFGEPA